MSDGKCIGGIDELRPAIRKRNTLDHMKFPRGFLLLSFVPTSTMRGKRERGEGARLSQHARKARYRHEKHFSV